MASTQKHAFVLAGTSSGCGKTTLTLGLLCALAARGLRVQPGKVGPDYLDTGWHQAISGVPSCNLDSFMLPESTLNALFRRRLMQADIAVIEGVMGLYDGYGSDPNYCSSAALAKQLGCPVVLVVDGKAVSTSIAATVLGFQQFDPALTIAGVIVNRVNSDTHYQLLKHAIEHYCRVPVLGRVPVQSGVALPSRHLGLVGAGERAVDLAPWRAFGQQLEHTLDIDRLLAMSALDTLPAGQMPPLPAPGLADGLTLGLAQDAAFSFYYPDSLALLADAGISLVSFSPLHDRQIPDCDMLWFGGGYPELHADTLSANQPMRQAVQDAHRRGIPIYGECGGLMYLGQGLTDADGDYFAMVGVLDGESHMGDRLTRFGYCEATARQDTLLAAAGESLRGHEFHYSDFTTPLPPQFDCLKTRDGSIQRRWQGGWQVGNTLGSYLHLHFAQRPAMLNGWLRAARSHR
ncbi:cobyrinate a,c-diamide synthase [Shimwellia pseudoproteus]|uniref:cobyrinate a,c-diamide synthase n=1 Tax=Shimwellia pseudoproteus TaxID=570012 RepID=UPI0018EA93D0|nr:cobyrinate a,c-diamide synthase [Shimwellia pseudoproteus]MBJ3814669.1 cobyrinate a,c-diamide synthase [Shimwellia pseudoproteus]